MRDLLLWSVRDERIAVFFYRPKETGGGGSENQADASQADDVTHETETTQTRMERMEIARERDAEKAAENEDDPIEQEKEQEEQQQVPPSRLDTVPITDKTMRRSVVTEETRRKTPMHRGDPLPGGSGEGVVEVKEEVGEEMREGENGPDSPHSSDEQAGARGEQKQAEGGEEGEDDDEDKTAYDAIDLLMTTALAAVEETSGCPVYWLRRKPLNRLPSFNGTLPHALVLNAIKLRYSKSPLGALQRLLTKELTPDAEATFLIELSSPPRPQLLAASLALLQTSLSYSAVECALERAAIEDEGPLELPPPFLPFAALMMPYDEETATIASLYTDALFLVDDAGTVHRLVSHSFLGRH